MSSTTKQRLTQEARRHVAAFFKGRKRAEGGSPLVKLYRAYLTNGFQISTPDLVWRAARLFGNQIAAKKNCGVLMVLHSARPEGPAFEVLIATPRNKQSTLEAWRRSSVGKGDCILERLKRPSDSVVLTFAAETLARFGLEDVFAEEMPQVWASGIFTEILLDSMHSITHAPGTSPAARRELGKAAASLPAMHEPQPVKRKTPVEGKQVARLRSSGNAAPNGRARRPTPKARPKPEPPVRLSNGLALNAIKRRSAKAKLARKSVCGPRPTFHRFSHR